MELTYRLNENELNDDFIKTIKRLYKGKNIEVTIQVQEDETSYLMKSEANRKQLLSAVKDVEKRKGLQELDVEKLKSLLK